MRMQMLRNRYFLICDIIFTVFAYVAVIVFEFPASFLKIQFMGGIQQICATIVLFVIVFYFMRIYHTDWVHAAPNDYFRLIAGCAVSSILSILTGIFLSSTVFFLKFNVAAAIAVSSTLCAIRFLVRLIFKFSTSSISNKGKRLLIVGAGSLAVMLARDIQQNSNFAYNVIGFIDDDENKMNQRICGVKVLGGRKDITRICEQQNIDEIIFAIHNLPVTERTELLNICSETGRKVKILPGVEAVLNGTTSIGMTKEIDIEDLLERAPITLNNKLIYDEINGKTVLVTGGGGSIGSELCRQILKFNPERLVIFDIYENSAFELQNELLRKYPGTNLDVIIGSVRDFDRLERIFSHYKPHIVFHAAAHKHVPLMEDSPGEAIKNNVFGTYNTAICAQKHNTKRFVLISTDKAVNPTNVMGATKRMCEMIVQTLEKTGECDFVAVRFGNVLGSNGSVIPSFKKQIEMGGPVTVTHREITRFFMTIPEAAQLVLQAAGYAKGGEIFVLDMGKPVKIYDLAKKMILLSGYKPDVDIKIEFTGLRPGEKLYEELLMNEEGLQKTSHSKIFIGQPIDISPELLKEKLNKLQSVLDSDVESIKKVVQEVVPTYKPVQ